MSNTITNNLNETTYFITYTNSTPTRSADEWTEAFNTFDEAERTALIKRSSYTSVYIGSVDTEEAIAYIMAEDEDMDREMAIENVKKGSCLFCDIAKTFEKLD